MQAWPLIQRIDSTDSNVSKFVFTKSNAVVESVLYKYPTYEERTVICCSTESGCRQGCRFCGTGDYFVRSLTAQEIVEQPEYLLSQIGIDPSKINKLQIMFMSMGEPMMNWQNLKEALKTLYFKYPHAKLLISTSAPIRPEAFKELNDLSVEIPTIGLQFSVHESTNEKRKQLIPGGTLTLEEISKTGIEWFNKTGRNPFFNYCVHPKNNSDLDIENILKFFDPTVWQATLSVICEREENVAAANERQRQLALDFSDKLLNKGYSVRVFNPAGQDDISAGCGQLWFVQKWIRENPQFAKRSAGFNLPKVHTPR